MPPRGVNAATLLAEASKRLGNVLNDAMPTITIV